jgi:hypothetical protein
MTRPLNKAINQPDGKKGRHAEIQLCFVILPQRPSFNLSNTNHAYTCFLFVSLVRMSASPEIAGATTIIL